MYIAISIILGAISYFLILENSKLKTQLSEEKENTQIQGEIIEAVRAKIDHYQEKIAVFGKTYIEETNRLKERLLKKQDTINELIIQYRELKEKNKRYAKRIKVLKSCQNTDNMVR